MPHSSARSTPAPARKAALVTGGALRIGRALCERLADDGLDLAIHCNRSETEAVALCRHLRERHPGIDCGVFPADLANPADAAGLLSGVARSFPHLRVLVCSAASYRRAPLSDSSDDLLEDAWRVNALAPVVLAREFAAFLRALPRRASGDVGHIVNLLDCRIAAPRVGEFAYALSKRTLAAATELLALELAPDILVNGVAPGSILPPDRHLSHDDLFRSPARDAATPAPDPAGTPLLARHPTPEDIAEAVSFLVRSPVVTGHILPVDSGLRLTRP